MIQGQMCYSRDTQTISTHRCSFGCARKRFQRPVPPKPFDPFSVFRVVPCNDAWQFKRGFGKLSDRTITCRDCGQAFTFTAGEQAFYAERGYSEPQRCSSCRAARKAQRSSDSYGDSSYGGGGGYGGGSYGGGGGRSSYSSGPREMHAAVCSNCGKQTEVPF